MHVQGNHLIVFQRKANKVWILRGQPAMTLLDKTLDTSLVSIEKAMFQVSVLYKWKVICARKCLQGNKDTSAHNRQKNEIHTSW